MRGAVPRRERIDRHPVTITHQGLHTHAGLPRHRHRYTLEVPGCNLARSRFRETDLSGVDLEGADLTGVDLFQAIVDDARLAGADLRGAEVSGLDLRRMATYKDLKIAADQQFRLLDAMGLDVQPE